MAKANVGAVDEAIRVTRRLVEERGVFLDKMAAHAAQATGVLSIVAIGVPDGKTLIISNFCQPPYSLNCRPWCSWYFIGPSNRLSLLRDVPSHASLMRAYFGKKR